MKFLKKYYKVIGSIITVLALVFVVKKLVTMDVDWSRFADGKTLAVIVGCTLVQAAMVLFMTLPWLRYIRILSGIQIPTKSALPVYTRSNLMKYVPGNVFQYVGRNQLAADLHISHVDVACATLLDIVSSMVTPLLLILILMGKDMLLLFQKYSRNFLIILIAGILVLLLLILLLRWKFREPLKRYFEKYRKLLNRKISPGFWWFFCCICPSTSFPLPCTARPPICSLTFRRHRWDCFWEHICSPGLSALSHPAHPAESASGKR